MTTVIIVIVALALGQVIGAWIASGMILRPARRPLAGPDGVEEFATPEEFGQAYSEFEVPASVGTIRGWLVRAEPASRRAVILIHGISDNRMGMLPFLPILEPLNVNVALVDLRAHGESDGRYLTYGVNERGDVKAVIDWLIDQDLAQSGTIALLGHSLGGAIAIQTAAADDRVGAVVADGAFARLKPLIFHRAFQVFPPAVACTRLGIHWAERRAGFSVHDAAPVTVAEGMRCPILLIHGEADEVVPPEHAKELKAALGDAADLWMIPQGGHCDGLTVDEEGYTRRVRDFLRAHLMK